MTRKSLACYKQKQTDTNSHKYTKKTNSVDSYTVNKHRYKSRNKAIYYTTTTDYKVTEYTY